MFSLEVQRIKQRNYNFLEVAGGMKCIQINSTRAWVWGCQYFFPTHPSSNMQDGQITGRFKVDLKSEAVTNNKFTKDVKKIYTSENASKHAETSSVYGYNSATNHTHQVKSAWKSQTSQLPGDHKQIWLASQRNWNQTAQPRKAVTRVMLRVRLTRQD